MTTAKSMAADDKENEFDGDGVTGDGATARWAIMATMTTMVMGDDDDDNDCTGVTGDDDGIQQRRQRQ